MASVDVTRIASNIQALNALNSLQMINAKLALHQTRLSTGKRINSAADDPAGLTIATKMMARSEGLKASIDNISDARNMLSVAEGGLSTMTDIMIAMRTQAEKAASDTLGTTERATIQTQLSSYAQQLQDLVDQTKWNGVKLLDNSTGIKNFQTGVDEGEMTTWKLPAALDPTGLKISTTVDSAKATASGTPISFVNVSTSNIEPSGVLGNMTELSTGDYNFKILDKAASTTVGNVNRDVTSSLLTGLTSFTASTDNISANTANVMTSGKYTVEITSASDANNTSYKLTKVGDTSFGSAGSISVNNVNLQTSTRGIGATTTTGTSIAASTTTTIKAQGAVQNNELLSGAYTVELQFNAGPLTTTGDDTYRYRLLDASNNEVAIATQAAPTGTLTTGWKVLTANAAATTVDTGLGLMLSLASNTGGATNGGDAWVALGTGTMAYTQNGTGGALMADSTKSALGVYTNIASNKLGVSFASANFAALKTGETMTFEYIAKDSVKFSLNDGSGQALLTAQNSTGSLTGLVGYNKAGTLYSSGRGVDMKLNTLASVSTLGGSNTQSFVYERANQYSVNVSTSAKAGAYMTTVNAALDKVTSALSDLGALMARLTYKEEQSATAQVNIEGAYSRIMNSNMAEEQLNASKYTILQQTATAMLAQANAAPQSLLALFR